MNCWMPTVLFSCHDKTLVNNNLGRAGFIWFPGYCLSLRKDVVGIWRQDRSREYGRMLLAGILLGLPTATSLILPGPTSLVIVLPTSKLGHATSISNQENIHRDIHKSQSNPSNSMIKVSSSQLCQLTTKVSYHIYYYDNHIVGISCLWWGRLSSPLEDKQKVSHCIEFRPTESLAKRWTLVLNFGLKPFFNTDNTLDQGLVKEFL